MGGGQAGDGHAEGRAAHVVETCVVAELHPEVHFYKVDIDEDMDLATRFKVMSVPTLLYFRRGVVANKTIGVISASEMEQAIAEAK